MRVILLLWILALALPGNAGAAQARKEAVNFAACDDCHSGIQAMDEDHAFACATCHLRPQQRGRLLDDHQEIVRYPASPANVELFCGECHRLEIDRLKSSLHWTLAGMINQTRFLWGAQPTPALRYSAASNAQAVPLPESRKRIRSPADLVDDLLRRRCFTCHLGAPPPRQSGLFRGVGCAACHVPFADDGRYRGDDQALQGKVGYPLLHVFYKPIGTRQCLHCHNGPHIGADYLGLFQHDYHQSYRTPLSGGKLPQQVYLMDHHRLKADVHHEKGLLCVDCHDTGDVMGRGKIVAAAKDAVKVRCQTCHAPESKTYPSSQPSGKTGRMVKSRTGRNHRAPVRNPAIPAHGIPGMEKIHCLGCHARWGFMDYGCSLIRDDRHDLTPWSPWRLQGDAAVAELFDLQGRFLGKKAAAGPWLIGWRFRRWEYLTLGKDGRNLIVPMRPRYQYRISYVDQAGNVILDDVVPARGNGDGRGWAYMPFYPHTVQKRGRNCEACHGNPMAAGDGLYAGAGPDLVLTRPSVPVYTSMRLLTNTEKQKLMEKTEPYRRWRFKTLWWDYQGAQDD